MTAFSVGHRPGRGRRIGRNVAKAIMGAAGLALVALAIVAWRAENNEYFAAGLSGWLATAAYWLPVAFFGLIVIVLGILLTGCALALFAYGVFAACVALRLLGRGAWDLAVTTRHMGWSGIRHRAVSARPWALRQTRTVARQPARVLVAHAASPPRRLPLIVAATVGAIAVTGTYLVLRPDVPGVAGLIGRDCVPLEINASLEKEVLAEIADRYNDAGRTFGEDRCASVTVHRTTSGVARTALRNGWDPDRDGAPAPQVWSPTSSQWVDLLRHEATGTDTYVVDAGPYPSLAQSPLTIAMPRPMAEALGWPDQDIGWSDVLELSTNPDGWGSVGHPEWGPFTLGKDNPHRSTSGMAATVAAYYAATGLSSDITEAHLEDPEVLEFVSGVEAGVAHYADEALKFLTNLADADRQGRATSYISAVVLQEQLVHLYNMGNPLGERELLEQRAADNTPTVPLVAVHPADGTLMMDHPYVVLPSASADQKAAAADFLAFVQEPEQQQRFRDWGFRDAHGEADQELADSIGLPADHSPSVITPPSASILAGMLDNWNEVRKKARVLLVFDVSGSMNDQAGGGRTRLEAAKEAAIQGLDELHPEDEVGLWAFSSDEAHPSGAYEEVMPLAPIGEARDELVGAIGGLYPSGGTALYHTVRAAHQHMLEDLATDRINAVVVLTDGRNEYPRDNDLDMLLGDIDAADLERSVRVFSIAFGEDSDLDTLTRIGRASKAAAYDAQDPSTINDVFVSVLSNF